MSTPPPAIRRRLTGVLAAALAVSVVAVAPAAAKKPAPSKPKYPWEQTSSTGNFFTLEAYDPPGKGSTTANFEMKVCTSDHTPAGTALEPLFFQVALSGGGGMVIESPTIAKSPALKPTPLGKKQCVEGWLGFAVPSGKSVASLVYIYGKRLTWTI